MKLIKKYINFILLLIIIILLIIFFVKPKKQTEEVSKNYYYMDTYINVKIYSNNKSKAKKALDEIENIYKEYHELSDRYNEYPNLTNIYTLNHKINNDQYIELNPNLYNIIKLSKDYFEATNQLFNINMGNIIDIWKKYRDVGTTVPTIEELKMIEMYTPNDIILDNGKIKNSKLNIDLGAIAKGYATQEVANYLKKEGLNKFLINAGGNVVAGDHYKNDYYKIGLQDPNKKSDIYKVVKVKNKSVVTSGSYERKYEVNGQIYHHIINPKTLFPSNYMKSVTIIADDSKLAEVLSTTLFLMPLDEGQLFVKKFKNVEVIWFTNENDVIATNGVDFYEQT